jgi:hypothetical protein
MKKWDILDVRWFGIIGIVRVDTHSGIRYFIGNGKGIHEQADMQRIADWGMSFDNDAGDVLFGVKNDKVSV